MTGSEPRRASAEDAARTDHIRALNDQFRTTFLGGRVMLTSGITNLAGESLAGLLVRVRQFEAFDSQNDPYNEHDFGAIEWNGETIFWKIDYYDLDLLAGSPNPADVAVTARVLTIMLAWEY